jgi:hypothetical protein
LPLFFVRIPRNATRTLKNPTNWHVKPFAPKNHHPKIHKQLEINHLQAKNKSAKTGILVSLNSLKLKVDRKQKARPGQKPGLRL